MSFFFPLDNQLTGHGSLFSFQPMTFKILPYFLISPLVTRYSMGGSVRPVLPQIRPSKERLASSKSHGSSKSATFDEWLVEKKSKKHQKQQKEKEEKLRKQIEQESKRLARIEGQKSFEDWKNSKSKQKLDLSALEKKRDDIIREEPGRHYSLSFERWLSRNHGTLDLYY